MEGGGDDAIFSSRSPGWGDASTGVHTRRQDGGRRGSLRGTATGAGGAAQQCRHGSAGGVPAAPGRTGTSAGRTEGPQPLGPAAPGGDRPLRGHHPGHHPTGAGAVAGGTRPLELRAGVSAPVGQRRRGPPAAGAGRHSRRGAGPGLPRQPRWPLGDGLRGLPAGGGRDQSASVAPDAGGPTGR